MARIHLISVCIFLVNVVCFRCISAELNRFIVLMDTTVMPRVFPTPHHWYQNTLSTISSKAESPQLLYSYKFAIDGFSAILNTTEYETIKKSPGYIWSMKDRRVKVLTTHSSDFLGLNSISGAWPDSEYGRNTIIGVVDTGIWPESKSFSDDGIAGIPLRWKGGCYGGKNFSSSFCNKKLIGARFFLKGLKAQNPNSSYEDSARDIDGHGTHVSSIAAGNYVHGSNYLGFASGTAKGIAPQAHLAIYKFGFEEDATESDLVAALDGAISDGVDVLSLSIASAGHLYEDVLAIASFSAVRKGIFVSRAAGNSGTSLWSIQGAAPWELLVGADTLDRRFIGTVVLGNGVSIIGSSFYPLDPIPPHLPLLYTNSCGHSVRDGIGKIVLCHAELSESMDSGSAFVAGDRFVGTGVRGAIVIWPVPDFALEELTFPAIFITEANSRAILDYISQIADPMATLMFRATIQGEGPAPKVADFSSSGPSLACPSIVKPDVVAPGYKILASWKGKNKVHVDSGTSMAAPHAAGVAALLKGVHPDWSPAAIRSAMMTTADVLDNLLNPIQMMGSNESATPLDMGAGHINPNKAIDPGLVYDIGEEGYINYLCGSNFTHTQIRAIVRGGYSCPNPTGDLNYPSFMANFSCKGNRSKRFRRTLTNVGHGMSRYSAKSEAIDGFKIVAKPDTLIFKTSNEKQSYTLTVQGKCLAEGTVLHGSISWVEIGGHQRVVRSPIVVASLTPPSVTPMYV